ncbi:MAG: PAS domain S-box protein, partial [Candidatus Aminicenantes bacterium]|nr:PAS domain S-box protein [Candidatus Aminicenantes bacterium]
MEKKKLRILIVEDVPSDAELLEFQLHKRGMEFISERVEMKEDFLKMLREFKPDLILSDYSLPHFDGMTALRLTQELAPTTPFILVTGSMNEETAVECMKAGAADYIIKDHIIRIVPSIKAAFEKIRVAGEKEKARKDLKESEERYRSLFERVPVGLYRTTSEGQVLDVNPALVRLMGYPSREAMLTIHVADGYGDEKERKRWQTLMEREGVVRGAETQWRRFDGTIIWVRESALAIRDNEGRITHYEGVVEDFTEHKQAEETLRESEKKYRNLVESISDVIYAINSSGVLTYISPVVKNILGYEPDELIGRKFLEFVHKEDQDLLMRRYSELSEGIVKHSDYRLIGKHGDIKWVRTLTNPIIEEGGFVGARGVIIDITERKRAEEALQERVKELRCIADISRLAEESGISIEKFVKEVVSILPSTWQYPEICSARITMDSKEFKTANFRETEWSQSADIKVNRMKFGALTVCYLEEKPEADEGPFLKEERSLINTVADFMGHIIQHRRTEVEIRDSETRFRTIFDSANDGMLLVDMEGKKFHSGNATICRMLGYSQEEIKNMEVTDIHPEKAIPHVFEQFEKQFRKEISVAQSLPVKRKDGSIFYADISSAPVEISGKRYLLGIFRDITERKRAEEQLQKSLQQTKKVLEDVVLTLSSIVEKRDPYTAGHQRRVADLACAIAGELNLPEVQIEGIRVAGIIHDIGKINVPAEILSKTGRLSDAEFNIIKTHAQVGKEILEPIEFPWPVAQVVHQHHERLNGTGYPQGLSDGKIILEAKIMAVADVVEAMASHRPYRP